MRARVAVTICVMLACASGCAGRDDSDASGVDEVKADESITEVKIALDEVDDGADRLGVTHRDAELRDIYFYDTESLLLFDRGIILRTRRASGKDDDSTIKVRPLSASQVSKRLFRNDGFKCEFDMAVGKDAVSSCSFTDLRDGSDIKRAARGDSDLAKLFTDDQREFLSDHGTPVDWSTLRPFGPIQAEVWKLEPKAVGEEVTVERWSALGSARSLEVSVKVKSKKAQHAQQDLIDWVASRGMKPSTNQEPKKIGVLQALGARPSGR